MNTNQKWNVSIKEKEHNPIQEYKQFVTSLFKAKSQRNPVSKPVSNQPLTKHIRWDKIDYSRVASQSPDFNEPLMIRSRKNQNQKMRKSFEQAISRNRHHDFSLNTNQANLHPFHHSYVAGD